MRILLPAFQFNLAMQYSTYSICEVLPYLNIMLSKWARMNVPPRYENLCKNLIDAFKHKFHYELNSPVYQVGALLNVSKLPSWISRNDCQTLKKQAINQLTLVAKDFLKERLSRSQSIVSEGSNTFSSQSSKDSMLALLEDNDYMDNNENGKKFHYTA